jgi:hypothetical protein
MEYISDIYPQFFSRGQADQLKFTVRTFREELARHKIRNLNVVVYLLYTRFDSLVQKDLEGSLPKKNVKNSGKNTIADLTNSLIDSGFTPENEVEGNFSSYPRINSLISKVVRRWFLFKKPPEAFEVSEETSNKGKDSVIDRELEPYVRVWIETFISIAQSLNISGWDKIVKRIRTVKDSEKSSLLGWYSPRENSITINTLSVSNSKKLVAIFKRCTRPLDYNTVKNKDWDRYFGYSFPASTLPHELEHARRSEDHITASHSSIKDKLWEDDIAQERTFDQSANAVFTRVISSGFYEKLIERIKQIK